MAFSHDGRRIEGTDVGTGKIVYQVRKTRFSNPRKYRKNYEKMRWDKEDEEKAK